jgi:catechol 2,3-dioxygenase-like lactoylglutathione lyase family enzyme
MSQEVSGAEPLRPWRFGYAVVAVPDVSSTAATLTRYFKLVGRAEGDSVKVRGGDDHHWVVLEPGPEKVLRRLAFEMPDAASLEAMAERLTSLGVPIETGNDMASGIGDYIRFNDPDGNPFELYYPMISMPVPVPRRMINTAALLHGVLLVPDVKSSFEFYSTVLGFRASDWVEDAAVFMRAGNGYHHSLALVRSSTKRGLDHLCFLMEGLDDLMRLRARARADGITSRADIKRHSQSGGISYYITDETSGLVLESCWEHRIITDENHRARILPMIPESMDLWLVEDDEVDRNYALEGAFSGYQSSLK